MGWFLRRFFPNRTPDWYTEGMETLPKQPRLQKVGSRYRVRVKVPADLRKAIGKREIKKRWELPTTKRR